MGILDIGAGAAEGLEAVLARDRQQELLRLQQREQAEQERSARATEGFRDRQLQQQGAIAGLSAQMAGQARQQQEQLRVQQEQNRVRDDARAELGTIPMGSVVPEMERDRYVGVGAGAPARFSQLDMTSEKIQPGTVQPDPKATEMGVPASLAQNEPQYELQGTPREIADRAREEHAANNMKRLEEQESARNAQTDRRLDIMETRTGQRGPTRTMRVVASTGPHTGQRVVQLVGSDGQVLHEELDQMPAGMFKDQAVDASNLNVFNDIRELGRRTGWKGVGGLGSVLAGGAPGSVQQFFKSQFNVGNDEGSQLRSLIANLRTQIGHEMFGSAFTATEKAQLAAFAPTENMASEEIQNRLTTLERIVQTRMQQRTQGSPITPVSLAPFQPKTPDSSGGVAPSSGFIIKGSRPAGGR